MKSLAETTTRLGGVGGERVTDLNGEPGDTLLVGGEPSLQSSMTYDRDEPHKIPRS